MGLEKCAVPGCEINSIPRHRFPNFKKDHSRFLDWMNCLRNEDLSNMTPQEVYDKKKVCHRHFEQRFISAGSKRLHIDAVPTLYMPPETPADSEEIMVSLESLQKRKLGENTNSGVATPKRSKLEDMPSCSQFSDPEKCLEEILVSMELSKKQKLGENTNSEVAFPNDLPSCSKSSDPEKFATPTKSKLKDIPSCSQFSGAEKCSQLISTPHCESSEHTPVRKRGISTPRAILKSSGIANPRTMTPRKRFLYAAVKDLARELKRKSHSRDDLKIRLHYANTCAKKLALEDAMTTLKPLAQQFIRCQLREAGKFGKQHRFTTNEKIMALSLYKQSPKSYRFLSKVFALPSKATLNNFLSSMHFETGINDHIFTSLKKMTDNWKQEEKNVILMWDEISLKPHFDFHESIGQIIGFKDIGKGRKSNKIADHALVFMIRGLQKRFKQPICYTFTSNGGVKVHELKAMVHEILRKILEIGLKPISTICDQATTNVRTLQSLMDDTKEIYIRNDMEYMGEFIEIDNFKIFPIYDPPHLLKGIRNNFMSKNIKFCTNSCKKTAKWQHIRSIYEIDNAPNTIGGLQVLPHLTEDHINPKQASKMKVKYAAQIFSHKVASSLHLASKIDTMKSLGDGANDTAELLFFFDNIPAEKK